MKAPLFFPLQGTTLQFVDKTNNENKSKKEHGAEYGNASEGKFTMRQNPGDEKNHIDIEEDKKHRGYIKFNGITGTTLYLGGQPAFVRRIFDLTAGGFLSK